MIRVLAMIAVAGFLLSAVCLSIAVGIAGPEVISQGAWTWVGPFGRYNWNNAHHAFGWSHTHADDGPQASRDLAWTGGDALEVDVPADVHFTQADGPARLVVRGPRDVIDHVVVQGGHLRFDRPAYDAADVTVELTAPKIRSFGINGSGKLDIRDYRQDELNVHVSGDGDVSAAGATKTLNLVISGSGDADLSGLAADGADVKISGSGQAKVGPKTWAKLDITGSGDVTLLTRPGRLESHVTGSGTIDQEDGASPEPDEPAKAGKPV
ncbi:MAG: hypothetical protein JWP50_2607 [Phenylobacterium sp.]|nr:hypothetical protein [Phenylobacterium sp.]